MILKKGGYIGFGVFILIIGIIFMISTTEINEVDNCVKEFPDYKYCGSYASRKCAESCKDIELEPFHFESGGFGKDSCTCIKDKEPIIIY